MRSVRGEECAQQRACRQNIARHTLYTSHIVLHTLYTSHIVYFIHCTSYIVHSYLVSFEYRF